MNSISNKNKEYGQLSYRLSIILTAIGFVILLVGFLGVFVFLCEDKFLYNFVFVGGIVLFLGLVGIPLITWHWMMKQEKKP